MATTEFSSTGDLYDSLDVSRRVAENLSRSEALAPGALPVTNAISCATVVLLSGLFESFLKDIVKEFIEKLNVLKKPLDKIPYDMKMQHISNGAKVLEFVARADKKAKSINKSNNLALRISSISDPNNYTLAWEAFADTKSNPGPDVVKSIMKGLGAEDSWNKINDLAPNFGSFEVFLQSFISMRNVCAHTGQHSSPPTGPMLSDHIDGFRLLAECIDLLLAIRFEFFESLQPTPA